MNEDDRSPEGAGGTDAATPARILEAATDLFSSRGFARTTIRQIADRARANSALIYYYFGSKGGLLEALVAGIQEAVHTNLERSHGLSGTPREKVERFIRLQVELLRRRSPLLRILLREVLNQNEMVLFAIRRAIEPNLAMMAGLIREGIDAGEFRAVDPALAARTLVGSLVVPVVIAPLILGDDAAASGDALADHIVELYLRGIEA